MEFQRLPSGAKVVISAIWEISDAPRGSVACVHSRWKVGTLAVRCGMDRKHLHRWLARIDARRRRQHEAAGRGTPAGYLGDWIETRCHLGRYLSCTAFASPSTTGSKASLSVSNTEVKASPETPAGDPDTPVEAVEGVAPARQQVSRLRDSRCRARATTKRPPLESTSLSPPASTTQEREVASIGAAPAAPAETPSETPQTPAVPEGAGGRAGGADEVRAFLRDLGVLPEIAGDLAGRDINLAQARATWREVSASKGGVGLLVKRLRSGQIATPRPSPGRLPPPPRIDEAGLVDPKVGVWVTRLIRWDEHRVRTHLDEHPDDAGVVDEARAILTAA